MNDHNAMIQQQQSKRLANISENSNAGSNQALREGSQARGRHLFPKQNNIKSTHNLGNNIMPYQDAHVHASNSHGGAGFNYSMQKVPSKHGGVQLNNS